MDHGREAHVRLVIARRNPPERLQLAKEVLNQVAPAVHHLVIHDLAPTARLGRDHRNRAPRVQLGPKPVIVESLVPDQRRDRNTGQQRWRRNTVVPLTRKKNKAHQIAQPIHQHGDLGCQTPARAADGLRRTPFFAPVPC
jgi:hypothetical protein